MWHELWGSFCIEIYSLEGICVVQDIIFLGSVVWYDAEATQGAVDENAM